jgi:hypothetical protein
VVAVVTPGGAVDMYSISQNPDILSTFPSRENPEFSGVRVENPPSPGPAVCSVCSGPLPRASKHATANPLAGPRSNLLQSTWVQFLGDLETRYGMFEWFGHFTFAEPLHPEQANKRWLRFVRQVNRKLHGNRHYKHDKGITWVRGQENQKREAIHYHGFFGNGVRKLRRMDFVDIWHDVCDGICRIYAYDGRMNAKDYITKYVVKEGEIDVFIPKSLTDKQ